MNLVILDNLTKDGIAKEPINTGKRQHGRSYVKRLRKRSTFDPMLSTIVCSICKLRDYNKRTWDCQLPPSKNNVCDFINNPT
jgi:hypothetical protein